ncbi:MAG: PspC domain-containing protein [Candidatus Saccharimonadales bacterium]
MKEITRIHLAKVAYDIELDAKHELEKYLNALSKHTDEEVMADIESRIVELLAERGVTAGGVVTSDDVADIRMHLGEPKDFVDGDTDESVSAASDDETLRDRRLYRDMDNALLGGVLSGIAVYFRIDPVIVRVIFVVIAVGSFGWALLVYGLLWFLIPPAETAGQKLQLRGKPITASTIREFSEREFTNERLQTIRNFLSICAGIGAAAAAICAVFMAIVLIGQATLSGDIWYDNPLVISLLILGATFASWMFVVMSGMFFRQKFTAQEANKIAILFVLTLLSGGGVVVWRIVSDGMIIY